MQKISINQSDIDRMNKLSKEEHDYLLKVWKQNPLTETFVEFVKLVAHRRLIVSMEFGIQK